MANEQTTAKVLRDELDRRFWALFDAARVISLGDVRSLTVEEWVAFHLAVNAIPESAAP